MGENISSHISDQALISEYVENSKLNHKKTNNPIQKRAKDLNRHFSQEDMQMVSKHMNVCSTSQMLIKTTVRYHLTPIGMVRIEKMENKCW